ncbi:high-affinity zinc uptake system membrane protein ZnuB [Paenibacillus baekrokdamisoli]|uniref:High-affinity zinc uptake system membrane protein ZnuB n=1 Tax=Paenibacillus baekrokdamisoli TaxID=1712516 RepID=A0A3G9JC91_9BACL|nr:metal ABC transporter permease [Paenibacillus baekrokdamisoli]MBB3072513.1 zinc transport system permease protein [Paenibacillus baekrokdamisoli]BBH20569.1 high-affinity zinc uptake system membrane protein ZnuB [Paenibacillus baekrokdamisoli]
MEMLHYDFMQRAFCAGGIIALLASVLGVYLMLRRQELMADMLSHVSLAGVAGGAYLHINPTLTGFAVAVVGAIAVEYVRRSYKTYSEISIAIIMVGGLSSAVVLMSLNQSVNKSFSSYLFGSVVAVNQTELLLMIVVAVVGLAFFYLFRRPLYQISFDEETARTNGLPVKTISLCFSVLTGMIVAAAMPIVGVLLVSSLIILPAALAIRIAPSFTAALFISMVIGLVGVFSGLTTSYELSTPPGGTIALILLVFLIAGISIKKLILKLGKRSKKNKKEIEGALYNAQVSRFKKEAFENELS